MSLRTQVDMFCFHVKTHGMRSILFIAVLRSFNDFVDSLLILYSTMSCADPKTITEDAPNRRLVEKGDKCLFHFKMIALSYDVHVYSVISFS